MINNKMKLSLSDRIFYSVNGVGLFIIFLVTLYPIVYITASSFSSPEAVTMGKVFLWPVDFSIEGYTAVFRNKNIITGYTNSIIYTLVGTLLNVSMTLLAAYALSRREMFGFKFINFLFAFTMWFNGGMVPTYLLMKNLGILNTRFAMWVPGMIGIWNVIITRTFFQSSIPEELYESASIDGCSYYRYFSAVVMPLSGAIIAVISMFYAVSHWNAYFNAFLYLTKKELFPLQIILREILIQNTVTNEMLLDSDSATQNIALVDLLKFSLIMVACIPVWCIYPFVQKFFVKGIMVGSIKG